MRRHVAIALGLVLGCGPREPVPSPSAPDTTATVDVPADEPTAPTADPFEPPAPTASAAPPATASAPPPPAVNSVFPPLEDTCKTDSDCAPTEFNVGQFPCCSGCGGTAGTKAWVAKAAAVCKKREAAKQLGPCPPSDCAQPIAQCSAGRCVQR